MPCQATFARYRPVIRECAQCGARMVRMSNTADVSRDEPMVAWPTDPSTFDDHRPRVGVVTVNWNTRGLLARLLYGVMRVIDAGTVAEVVVVDNASEDGSRRKGWPTRASSVLSATTVSVTTDRG